MFGRYFSRFVILSLLVMFAVFSPIHSVSAQNTLQKKGAMPTKNLLNRHGLERAWWNRATLNPARDRIQYLVADKTVLYAQTRSGLVTAFRADSGKKLWSLQISGKNAPSFPVTSNEKLAIMVSGIHMVAVEKMTGKVVWRIRLPGAPSTGATIDETNIYIGTQNGSLYAFDIKKILDLYKKKLLPQWSHQTIRWRYKTHKTVTTAALSAETVVLFASKAGILYCVTTDQRKVVFQFETDDPISAPLEESRRAIGKDKTKFQRYLFLASENKNLYCLDMKNGRQRWKYTAGLPISTAAKVIGNDVYLTPRRGGVHCLEETTGKLKWKRTDVQQFLAASKKTVFMSDQLGNVILLSRKDGAINSVLPMRNFSVRMSNGRTDRLFMAQPDGLIICIHEREQRSPIFHKHADRPAVTPKVPATPNENEEKENEP